MVEIGAAKTIDMLALNGNAGVAITVASTGTVYLPSFPLPREASFAVHVKFTSGAAVDVKIEMEQSNVRPTTEQAADAVNYAEPDGASDVSTGITDENPHIIAFSPAVSNFARLKLTGQGSNAADTAISEARLVYVKQP